MSFKFADSVIARFIECLQEAMMSGVDMSDLLRQMETRPSDDDPHVLVLTDEYQRVVAKWRDEIVQMINKRKNDAEGVDESTTRGVICD